MSTASLLQQITALRASSTDYIGKPFVIKLPKPPVGPAKWMGFSTPEGAVALLEKRGLSDPCEITLNGYGQVAILF